MRAWVLVAILLCAPRPAVAYSEDFHYHFTYYLALQVGFTERQAFQIASAAQAIDDDVDTGPTQQVTRTEVLYTSYHPDANPRVGDIWRDLHCFAEYVLEDKPRTHGAFTDESWGEFKGQASNTDGLVAIAREKRRKVLEDLAAEQGNPGPQLHYEQDCFAHFDFNDLYGHALAGHAPDWISVDPGRASDAAIRTLDILGSFRRSHLGEEPTKPTPREWQNVLDLLIIANQVGDAFTLDEQAPHPTRPGWLATGWGPFAEAGVGAGMGWAFIDSTNPRLRPATDAVQAAVSRIRDPRFPEIASPPAAWHKYGYRPDARVDAGRAFFEVEDPAISKAGTPTATTSTDPSSPYLVKVDVSGRYTVAGVAPFWDGLPVLETCQWSDGEAPRRLFHNRFDGTFMVAAAAYRTPQALKAGVSWACVIQGDGVDEVLLDVVVPPVPLPEELADTAGADPALTAAAARVRGARDRAAAATAEIRTACSDAGDTAAQAAAAMDAYEEGLAEAEADLAGLEETAAALPAAIRGAATVAQRARTAAEHAAVANDALRRAGFHVCRIAGSPEPGETAADARRFLGKAERSRDELVRRAGMAREHADQLSTRYDAAMAAADDLRRATRLTGGSPPDTSAARAGLERAVESFAAAGRARNDAAGDAAAERARWDALPHSKENKAAFGDLVAAWRDLEDMAATGGTCIPAARVAVEDLESRTEIAADRAARLAEQARALAANLPDTDALKGLGEHALDASIAADGAELFVDAAVELVAEARTCLDEAPDLSTTAEAPPPPPPPPPSPPSGSGTASEPMKLCHWVDTFLGLPSDYPYCECTTFVDGHPVYEIVDASVCGR